MEGAVYEGLSEATNQLNKKEIRAVIKRMLASAKQAGRANKVPIAMSRADLGQGRVDVRPRVHFDAVGLDSRIDLLKEADAAATSAAERMGIKLPGRYLSLETTTTEKTIINSDGAKVYSRIPRVALDTFITAFHPERGSVQRMYNLGESTGWEGMERWDVPSLLGEEATALANVLLKAEAAKEEQGDKLVTLYPAIQLKLDDRIGSIKVGKDADLVIWNDHPLSIYSSPDRTYIDGRCYFDREADKARREQDRAEKATLVRKVLRDPKQMDESSNPAGYKPPTKVAHCEDRFDYWQDQNSYEANR